MLTKNIPQHYSGQKPNYLQIKPKELVYHPPFIGVISNQLILHNTSNEHSLAYKVKTTAPVRYCVRPNTGIIPPGQSVEVLVLLNCSKDMPSMKSEDKFQIQSIIVTDEFPEPKEIWVKSPQNIMKQKLKAIFSLDSPAGNVSKQQQQKQNDNTTSTTTTTTTNKHKSDRNDDNSGFSSTFSTINTHNNIPNIIYNDSVPSNELTQHDDSILHLKPQQQQQQQQQQKSKDEDNQSPSIKKSSNVSFSSSEVSATVKRRIPKSNSEDDHNNNDNTTTTVTTTENNDDLIDQIKKLKSALENSEKERNALSKTVERLSNNNNVVPTVSSSSQLQTLIITFIIALISFFFGKMI